jgi:hypothetical protein
MTISRLQDRLARLALPGMVQQQRRQHAAFESQEQTKKVAYEDGEEADQMVMTSTAPPQTAKIPTATSWFLRGISLAVSHLKFSGVFAVNSYCFRLAPDSYAKDGPTGRQLGLFRTRYCTLLF